MTALAPPPSEVSALLLAAGRSERFGAAKPFLDWQGQPLLTHAVERVQQFASETIVGVAADDEARARTLLGTDGLVLLGGPSRQETLGRLLERASRRILLIHDVARPFATERLFSRVLAECAARDGAVVPWIATDDRDALALRDGKTMTGTLNREDVIRLQTPMAMPRDILADAYTQARTDGWLEDSTPALLRRAGYPVRLMDGEPDNRKITHPQDWPPQL
jgi:2-C-methyl-D-erythritol 4-phosphate cytidylyltransferase